MSLELLFCILLSDYLIFGCLACLSTMQKSSSKCVCWHVCNMQGNTVYCYTHSYYNCYVHFTFSLHNANMHTEHILLASIFEYFKYHHLCTLLRMHIDFEDLKDIIAVSPSCKKWKYEKHLIRDLRDYLCLYGPTTIKCMKKWVLLSGTRSIRICYYIDRHL